MAAKTGTYSLINSTTLGSNQSSVTFSSIPSTFTDLILIFDGVANTGAADIRIQFNSDTATNYSYTYMGGSGSSAGSGRGSTAANIQITNGSVGISTDRIISISSIQDYSNSSTYKTVLSRINAATGTYAGVTANIGLWRSTSIITSINIFTSANNFASGSTFRLYGIEAGNL